MTTPTHYIDRQAFDALSGADRLRCYLLLRSGPVRVSVLARVSGLSKPASILRQAMNNGHVYCLGGYTAYGLTPWGRAQWRRSFAGVVRETKGETC